MMILKKSTMSSNWPKWLDVAQSVLIGSQDLEIRSHVSSFSAFEWIYYKKYLLYMMAKHQ